MAQVTGKGSIIPLETPEKKCRKWQLRVSLGRDYVTKKYITKTRRFEGTKREAEQELRAFINELESGIRTDTTSVTFGEFADRWVLERELAGEVGASALRNNKRHIKAVSKHIGAVRLLDLNSETISGLYIELKNGGSLSGKPLTGTTLHAISITLNQVLSAAVDRDIILRNPCAKVKAPKIDTPEKEALSKEEAKRMMSLLMDGEPDAKRTGALLALTCGLRREEVLGLRWSDFDPSKGFIRITHALATMEKKLKEPKSKAGKRTIPLDPQTLARLKDWKVVQATEFLAKGIQQSKDRPIIASEVGGLMHPENFGRWWGRWRKKNDFEGISFHQLRHTFATMMVANGVDIVTAKTLMGHSDTRMLTELYAHAVPENISRATELIGGILHGEDEAAKVIEVDISKTA